MMKREWFLNSVCGAVLPVALCLLHASAFATVYVDLNAPVGTNDGSSWANACLTVQDGLDASSSLEEIWVADGTYDETIVLGSGDVLYGGFEGYGGAEETLLSQRDWATNVTTIDASTVAAPNHVVTMDTVANTRVDGFTITGGRAGLERTPDALGGGLYCVGADATNSVANGTITGNTAITADASAGVIDDGRGGGVYCVSSGVAFTGCTITSNVAAGGNSTVNPGGDGLGGGVYCVSSSPAFTDCTISGNTAQGGDGVTMVGRGDGGGIYCNLSTLTVTGGVIDGNDAISPPMSSSYGGGIYVWDNSTLDISDCTISNNTGELGAGLAVTNDCTLTLNGGTVRGNIGTDNGGGIYLIWTSSFSVTGATIANNTSYRGGGVYAYASPGSVTESIISGNEVTTHGGGIFLDTSSPDITNCIISGNHADMTGGGISAYVDTTADIFNCTISGNTAGDYGGGVYVFVNAQPRLRNVVFEDNTNFAIYEDFDSGDPYVDHCLFANNPDGAYHDFGGDDYADGEIEVLDFNIWQADENLAGEPAFVMAGPDAVAGTWTGVSAGTDETTLTDSAASFTPGALVGLLINGDIGQRTQALIIANDATSVTVQGDVTGYAAIGDSYAIMDYHLEWTSAAIDAGTSSGTPSDDLDGLPRPGLAAHDIGAYEAQCSGAGPQDIDVSPTALDFGGWPDGAGASPAQAVAMVNLGGSGLTIASVTLTGADAGDFAIASDTGESPLTACGLRMVEVRFNPASAGPKSAALTIASDDPGEPTVDVALSGTGTVMSVLRVDHNAPGPAHDGSSWQDAFLAIEEGIAASPSGADIWIADGAYAEAITLGNGDVLYGGFEGYGGAEETDRTQRDWETNETIIDASTADGGAPAKHVVMMVGVTSTRLDGLTITGGLANGASTPGDSAGGILLLIANETNTIANCVVRDNVASFGGGGIGAAYSQALVQNCTISGNEAYDGAGVAWSYGTLNIADCTVTANIAGESGGGIACIECDGAAITDCVITSNVAPEGGCGVGLIDTGATLTGCTITDNDGGEDGSGGGIYCESPSESLEITDCLVSGNSVGGDMDGDDGFGGGIDARVLSAAIAKCVFRGNTADFGGGVDVEAESGEISNCVVSGNTAGDMGGGLYLGSGTPGLTVVNCTVSGNLAGMHGGGLASGHGSTLTVRNTLFEGNTLYAIEESTTSGDPTVEDCLFYNNPDGAYYDLGGMPASYLDSEVDDLNTNVPEAADNITGDPMFADKLSDNYRLTAGSAAIDEGAAPAPADDMDGNLRPRDIPGVGADGTGTEYDIGAYESQEGVFGGFTGQPQGARKYSGDSHTFTVTPNCPDCVMSYQWKWDDGITKTIHDVGGDSPAYNIPDVTGLAGDYWCDVTFAGDVYPSNAVTLEVEDHLAITIPPVGGEYDVGGSHSFSVMTAGGYAPLSYTWKRDGDAVSNDELYTIDPIGIGDAGWYTVEILDDNSDLIVSAPVELKVNTGLPSNGTAGLIALFAACLLSGGLMASRSRRMG